jgi:hypothetical protein
MRTAQQERDEALSISAWDRLWNDALTYILCDKAMAGESAGLTDLTEKEDLLLMLIHERRLPAGVVGKEGV